MGRRRWLKALFGAAGVLVLVVPSVTQAREAVWARMWGTPSHDFSYGVALDSAENSYVVGETNGVLPGETSAGPADAFVRSYDADGSLRWSHQFGTEGHDLARGVAVDSAGNAYVVGRVRGAFPGQTLTGLSDTFVRKYDTAGTEIWTRQFGFPDVFTEAEAAAVDDAGNVYVGGTNFTGDPGAEFLPNFVRKYDPDGNELWTHRYGRWPPGSSIDGLTFTAGTLFVAGDGPLEGTPHDRCCTAYLKAFDPDGTELWTREFGIGIAAVDDVASNASGRIVVTGDLFQGSLTGEGTGSGLYVRVYDPEGNVIWTREYDDNVNDFYNGAAVDDAGNVFVGGTHIEFDPFAFEGESGAAEIRRFDADGNQQWKFVIDPAPPNSVVTDLAVPGGSAIYVAGAADGDFAGAEGVLGIDAYVLKLNQVGTCVDTGNPDGNEEGIVSQPVHRTVEPLLPAPVDGTVHEVNCTIVVPLGL